MSVEGAVAVELSILLAVAIVSLVLLPYWQAWLAHRRKRERTRLEYRLRRVLVRPKKARPAGFVLPVK